MKNLKAVIYCRVLDRKAGDLLRYQERVLENLAGDLDIEIVSSIAEVSDGKNFCSNGMQKLMYYIRSQRAGIVIVYDKTRISIYDDLYAEFKMICEKHNTDILTLEEIKELLFIDSLIKKS